MKRYPPPVRGTSSKHSAAKALADTSETQHTFWVRDILDQDRFFTVTAEKLYRGAHVTVWVDTMQRALLETSPGREALSRLIAYATTKTPPTSHAPEQGIAAIVTALFGDLPDPDDDKRVDLLLLDIQDGFQPSGSYVAGFFDPIHLTGSPHSNRRDVVFVDLYPTLVYGERGRPESAAATFAHELQHLIHAGYEKGSHESVFINEGLSEYAEFLCGFTLRAPDAFLFSDPRSLLSWDDASPLPDYARAAQWTHFLFSQIGLAALRTYVADVRTGEDGLEALLKRHHLPRLEILHQRWATHMLQQVAATGQAPTRLSGALPGVLHALLPPLSFAITRVPLAREVAVEVGYITAGVEAQIALMPLHGEPALSEAGVSARLAAGAGLFADGYVVLSRSSSPDNEAVAATARIDGVPSGYARDIALDDGIPDAFTATARYFRLSPGQAAGLVIPVSRSRSATPRWLYEVSVYGLYMSEVSGSGVPAGTERDVDVEVWNFQNGRPAKRLWGPQRVYSFRAPGEVTFEAALLGAETWQEALPDTLMIVVTNDADDNNAFAVGLDAGGEGGFFRTAEGLWMAASAVSVQGQSLANFRPMLRARVLMPPAPAGSIGEITSTVSHDGSEVHLHLLAAHPLAADASAAVAQLPSGGFAQGIAVEHSDIQITYAFPLQSGAYHFSARVADADGTTTLLDLTWNAPRLAVFALLPPYPDPARTAAALPIHLNEAAWVTIDLYDLLGRRLMLLHDALLPQGDHRVALSFPPLASGTYFIAVQCAARGGEIRERYYAQIALLGSSGG